MRTTVGCLVWILVFVAVLLLERDQLQRLPALPRDTLLDGPLAALLTLGVTLTAGSLLGLLQALWQRLRPATAGTHWRDGEAVRVGGVLEPVGPVLQAPFSGRPAAYLSYSAHAPQRSHEGSVAQDPHFRGLQHVHCRLRAGTARIELRGFPSPRAVDEQAVDGPEVERAAARHLARTPWQHTPDIASVDLGALGNPFATATAGAGPDAGVHLINALAAETLGLPGLAGQEAALLQRLRQRRWHFKERVLAPGEPVTAVGTWRADPPHLDIGYGAASAGHALHPGRPEQLATRQIGIAVAFVLVLGALTAAAHALVWHQGGALVRTAGEALGIAW
jgi:hypothetical protein